MRWVLYALLVASCSPVRSAQADCVPAPERECRPKLEGTLLDGTRVGPESFRGKIVLVNFWATWCAPCVTEMPAFERVFARHRQDGFVILGVITSDGAPDDEVREFLAQRGVTYPVLRSRGDLEAGFRLGGVLPTSFLYDRSGKLVGSWDGAVEEEALESQVAVLLKQQVP
jgi:thiol-disulfide isomerase/thioredoxin